LDFGLDKLRLGAVDVPQRLRKLRKRVRRGALI
jgi:hypothetical protein